ncbi:MULTISPECIES: hypothetical protein [unclassified Methylophaga]|jgi:hypothetical protein|uniref:hypothetical protein n=1 Tax=unclassified Methylophaga TaxID=2629249 RepID=UPI00259D18F7|nr:MULTISPECIES: hypothetical protein [unclassified Methylophaga]|tara:strand:+ start:475 stop:855 length:381 start_codon:yes stop_codon:yes gene_type:complete
MKNAQKARLKLRCPITLGRQHEINVPSGWFELVFNLCAAIEDVAQDINKKHRQRMFLPRIVFIEEHQGKILCDVINGTRDINHIIKQAQMRSTKCCMICGDEGSQFRLGRTLVTRCEKHRSYEKYY